MSIESGALSGVIVPVFTPLTDDEQVDVHGLRRLLRRLLDAGVDGLFIGGTAGSGPLLGERDWNLLMETAASETAGEKPCLAGIIARTTREALQRIKAVEALGFSRIVVTPTYYLTLTQPGEFLSHFRACRDATSMGMTLYNIPSCTGSQVPLEVVRQMAVTGETEAFKESGGDRDYYRRAAAIAKETDISLLQGHERDIVWSRNVGINGMVPVHANIFPDLFVEAWSAMRNRDEDGLMGHEQVISQIVETVVGGSKTWLSGIAAALQMTGIGNGKCLAPIQMPDAQERAGIEGILKEHTKLLPGSSTFSHMR